MLHTMIIALNFLFLVISLELVLNGKSRAFQNFHILRDISYYLVELYIRSILCVTISFSLLHPFELSPLNEL